MEHLLLSTLSIGSFFIEALSVVISIAISSIVVAWTLSSKINTGLHRLNVLESDFKATKDKTEEYHKEQIRGFASADKDLTQRINISEEKIDKKLDVIQEKLNNISVDVGTITEIIKNLK